MRLPSFSPADVERRATEIGRELLHAAREQREGLFSARFWSDRLMSWAMKDPTFRVQLFRFIDVFPMLRTPEQVHDYLSDYLSQPGVALPPGMQLGLQAGKLAKGLMAKTIAGQITTIAQHFIAGADVAAALPTLQNLWSQGVAFSVDLLGEACLSQEEARAYQRRYLDLVETLSAAVAAWPADPRLESDHLGPLPRANISIKLSALCARADAIDFDGSLDALAEALQPILAAAAQRQVTVNFDMEQHALKDLTLALFERCCETHDFPAGLALQAYLLVRDPRVAMIAFTGSKEVGLHILRTAGDTPEGQGFVKKVVCEMGGKNAIIVDDSADPGTDLGPVIDAGAAAKIQTYIEIGREEGRLELAGEVPAGLADRVGKPYVGPHIFSEIRPHHRLANEEIFGPVLSLMRVGSFAEALAVANATAYKLTGGVFSRRPSHLEAARREFRVGNLYLNRGITGALVGRQPFGGFGLSGIGSKAGGADYLLHFVEPRSATENTMRHGFAPGLE